MPVSFDAVQVGKRLREARTALRCDLTDAARELRIRHVYLRAIEDGKLEDLPGRAYQTGFLRAYGNYLGFDGVELAEQLRAAQDTDTDRDQLQLFTPIEERQRPTRSVLLLAGLFGVAVYGAWYFMSDAGLDPIEKVTALPDRIAGLLDPRPDADDNAGATAAPPEPAAPDRADDGDGAAADAVVETGESEPEQFVSPPADATPPPETETLPEEALPETEPATVPATEPATTADASGEATPVSPQPRAPEDTGDQPAAAETPSAASTAEAPSETPAAVPRIVLRATADSWIEIRAGTAPPVYTGLLRAGESYTVPDQRGLKMVTGNAGGLDILVDGEPIPPLGPMGLVRRNIDLDPDSLRSRSNR